MPQDTNQDPFTSVATAANNPTGSNTPPHSGAIIMTTKAAQPLRMRLGCSAGPSQVQATGDTPNRIAIYKAAATVRRSPAFVMDLVNRGLVKAYRRGGPINRPWLAVDVSELLAVIDRETLYVPPAMMGRRVPAIRQKKSGLHPLAMAI